MRALESETVISSEEERFFPTAALIIFFSVLGALVRVGVVQLNTFPNEPVFPLVWAQVVGCLLYGFVQQRKAEIAAISFSLYVGLTTGLCGTITTFSSFMVSHPTFSSLGTHVVIVNVVAAFSVIGVTLGMAVVSILFGAFLSKLLPVNARLLDRPQYEMPKRSIFTIKGLSGLDWAFVALGIAAWIAAIVVLIITRNYAYFTGANLAFSCVLAPLGSLARWVLARINKRWRNFPTGTFAANIIGTTIRAVCSMVLIRSDGGHMTPMLLSFITGVKDGFCGGLTTLSTLANEMINLPPLSSVMYISVSVALSQ
ncbi:CrcB-like protein-domain-containing protein, partial [Chytriomyces sp. MP71]